MSVTATNVYIRGVVNISKDTSAPVADFTSNPYPAVINYDPLYIDFY